MFLSKSAFFVLALGALAAVSGSSSPLRGGETIRFTVEDGASSTKTFELSGDYRTALVEIDVSGMEVEIPDIELVATWTRKIVVSDEYESTRDGAPALLVRSYDTVEHELKCEIDIDGNTLVHTEEIEPECESELDGATVRFEWNDDAEVYEKAFVDDDDGDVDLLEGLTEDMDLRALLPEDEVDPGDRWEIDTDAFLAVLTPGGDFGIYLGVGDVERSPELSAAGLDPRMAGSLDVMLGDPTSRSDVSATFEEVQELDGHRVAVIAISAELETQTEAMELYEAWMRDYDPGEDDVPVDLDQAEVTFECELEGVLRWDLEAGHAHSLELAGHSMLTLVRSATIDADGQEVTVGVEIEMEGELEISASFE